MKENIIRALDLLDKSTKYPEQRIEQGGQEKEADLTHLTPAIRDLINEFEERLRAEFAKPIK